MKFVLLTYDGHGLPIAFKLQQERWDVIVGQAVELFHITKEKPELKTFSYYSQINYPQNI
ncbi:MAG: hypothetical protein NC926_11100 [Candidatus Omnitrophica bacterium]|nr:hypothetical protein [Candidatus Omnitrophota bacterium]